jgi:triphosphatase
MQGKMRGNKASSNIREAELGFQHGHAQARPLTEVVLDRRRINVGTSSRFTLADALATVRNNELRALPLSINAGSRGVEVFTVLLSIAARQIINGRLIVLTSDNPEGPHQIRIGLRRLRSVLKTLRPLVRSPSLKNYEALARDFAMSIGELRDADVVINSICAPVKDKFPEQDGFAEVLAILTRRRNAKQKQVRSLLKSAQWGRLQLYLTLWSETLQEAEPLKEPIFQLARLTLKKRWKKLCKVGRSFEYLSPKARHEMRKSLKQLRYLSEFFGAVFGKQAETSRFVARLKTLQDVFGYLNDVQLGEQISTLQECRKFSPQASAAVQCILDWHKEEARHVWPSAGVAWKKLRGPPKFWN